jgi:UDP-N-acetylglucosamine 1-carboxyvinyltransferase
MGADITGAGTSTIIVRGVEGLSGSEYRIIPDRIEAGTFAVAAAITRSRIRIRDCNPEHMSAVIEKLRETGVRIEDGEDRILVDGNRRLGPVDVYVAPYPGFPTDMQAQFMALLTVVPGTSTIKETIFENRFMQAMELVRMGADIKIEGDTAVIRGVKSLSGAYVMASDLRASASLVLAALVAKGSTVVRRIYHLDRGYEKFEYKLRRLGAGISREKE